MFKNIYPFLESIFLSVVLKPGVWIAEKLSGIHKFLMDHAPFEKYYVFRKQAKKYYKELIKPTFFYTGLASMAYIIFALYFKWGVNGIIILIIFIGFLIYDIVRGALYGEDMKKFYFKDE